jgi:hypothetical protein
MDKSSILSNNATSDDGVAKASLSRTKLLRMQRVCTNFLYIYYYYYYYYLILFRVGRPTPRGAGSKRKCAIHSVSG